MAEQRDPGDSLGMATLSGMIRRFMSIEDVSYQDMANRSGGRVSKARMFQILHRPMRNFPDPDTLLAFADVLGVPVRTVVHAAARELGLPMDTEPGLADLLPPGTSRLTDKQLWTALSVVRTMLDPGTVTAAAPATTEPPGVWERSDGPWVDEDSRAAAAKAEAEVRAAKATPQSGGSSSEGSGSAGAGASMGLGPGAASVAEMEQAAADAESANASGAGGSSPAVGGRAAAAGAGGGRRHPSESQTETESGRGRSGSAEERGSGSGSAKRKGRPAGPQLTDADGLVPVH